MESAPSIRVVHNRRDFSAGKQALKVGGRGRYEVLILFENNGDTPLADVQLKDVIPPGYEMDGCDVRANKELLDNVEMTQETDATGTTVVWHLPSVGKSERIDVSYMIKGEGDIDTDLLNTFHGAVFGDEIEDDEAPAEALPRLRKPRTSARSRDEVPRRRPRPRHGRPRHRQRAP